MCTYIDILKYRVVNEMTTQRATNKQQGNKETTTSEANGRTGDKYQFQVTLVGNKMYTMPFLISSSATLMGMSEGTK